jgi:hypothetical protein
MSRAPATFRQRHIATAVKAVMAAGYDVLRIENDTELVKRLEAN